MPGLPSARITTTRDSVPSRSASVNVISPLSLVTVRVQNLRVAGGGTLLRGPGSSTSRAGRPSCTTSCGFGAATEPSSPAGWSAGSTRAIDARRKYFSTAAAGARPIKSGPLPAGGVMRSSTAESRTSDGKSLAFRLNVGETIATACAGASKPLIGISMPVPSLTYPTMPTPTSTGVIPQRAIRTPTRIPTTRMPRD